MKIAMTRVCAWISFAFVTSAPLAAAPTVETFAGGRQIHDLPANFASVNPSSVAAAPDGTVYIVDWFYKRLLRRDPLTAKLYTIPLVGLPPPNDAPQYNTVDNFFFAPNGTAYVLSNSILFSINPATGQVTQRARLWRSESPDVACNSFNPPGQFAADANGAIYYTDYNTNAICKIVNSFVFYIHFNTTGYSGDGGPYGSAQINRPTGIAVDAANNLYIADQNNHRIRKITAATGIITTIAGNGNGGKGGENLVATTTPLSSPGKLTLDSAGNLYIVERGNYRVRRLDAATGRISTVSGNGLQVTLPQASGVPATSVPHGILNTVAMHPSGDLLISDDGQRLVRRVNIATGLIDTIAGNGAVYFCGETSPPREACIDLPRGVAVDGNGDVYIADSGNRRVRKFSPATGLLTTIAGRSGPYEFQGNGGPATDVLFPDQLWDIALDAAGNLYIAGSYGYRIYRIDKLTGILTSIAGTGVYGFTGDGGPATSALISIAESIAVDAAGNVFFSDTNNNRVRKIAAGSGIITTVAGTGLTSGPLGDGGPATAASLDWPRTLAFDRSGNLLILDYRHNRIRSVDKTTGIITTVIGNGTWGTTGDGGPANLASIASSPFAVDPGGNIFLVNGTMRRVDAQTGIITTVPNVPIKSPEGFSINPYDMAFDANGQLYDATSQAVLKISGLPVTIPDTTPPVVGWSTSGLLGADGWYRSDVLLTWMPSDPESGVLALTDCQPRSIMEDTDGLTFTCTARSEGGTTSSSVTIRRDATPPTLEFGALSPAPNGNGWNGGDVSVPFTVSDATSGVAETHEASPLVFTTEGIGMRRQVVVADVAGNTAAFESPAVSIDRTPPLVTPDVLGTLGNDGWYTSDVQVGWNVNEIPASLESTSGCDPSALAADTGGTNYTCSATSAGGTTSKSVLVRRDATPPAITFGAVAPAPDANGWNSGDVSIPFEVTDALSGVASASTPSPIVLAQEGVGITRPVTVTDLAGNSATFESTPVNIDRTPPIVTAQVSGTLGNAGWYTSDVVVEWTVNELVESLVSTSGCEPQNVTADTAGITFTCTAVSAGGITIRSVTLKRDATAPVLTFGTPSPVPNANGWNKTNVSIPFTRADALSGLASTSTTSPLVLSAQGAAVTGQVTVTDNAGNTATFTSVERNIDKAAPAVSITSPANGASYGFYQDVVADFDCQDLSLVSCVGTVADGALVNTRTAGARTFKVTGKDGSNFTTAVTYNFTVASTFNFEGFPGGLAPSPVPNLVSRGSMVPIRWQLPDGNGGFVTNTASFTSASVTTVSCSGTPVPYTEVASGPSGISFDAGTQTFTYNWQTGASWSGCRRLAIKLKDNSIRELIFRFQ